MRGWGRQEEVVSHLAMRDLQEEAGEEVVTQEALAVQARRAAPRAVGWEQLRAVGWEPPVGRVVTEGGYPTDRSWFAEATGGEALAG
jgi:hypothetical protein